MEGTERLQTPELTVIDERGLMDVPFLLLTLLLVAIGVIMMFSASYARAFYKEGSSTYYFARQGGFALAGIVVMWIVSRINYQWWRVGSVPIMAAAVVLLILVPVIGKEENGATRWIRLFGIGFQPSELAKLAVVLCFAAMISFYRDRMQTFRYGVLPFAGILVVIAGLLYLEPHLSATLIILATGAVMMFLGGTKLRWFGLGAALVALVMVVYLTTQGYASDRITAWRDPFSDQSDKGYQILQSLYAIGSGGMMGLGLGRSRQKYLYLPEEHNDYLFPIVCEELGFVGAVLVLLLLDCDSRPRPLRFPGGGGNHHPAAASGLPECRGCNQSASCHRDFAAFLLLRWHRSFGAADGDGYHPQHFPQQPQQSDLGGGL